MQNIHGFGCLAFGLSLSVSVMPAELVKCTAPQAPDEIAFSAPPPTGPHAIVVASPSAVPRLKGMSDIASLYAMQPANSSLNAKSFMTLHSALPSPTAIVVSPGDQFGGGGVPTPAPSSPSNLILSQLGYGPNAACTHAIASGAEDSNLPLINFFGDSDADIDSARKQYIANPVQYAQQHPKEALAFQNNIAKWQDVLSKCFKPASASPVYSALNVPAKLGHLLADESECLAYLISKDRILTARHCIYDSAALTSIYEEGSATFSLVGDESRHYQVCAAETQLVGKNQGLPEERILLRIAPVPQDVAPTPVFDAKNIKPLMVPKGIEMPTEAVVFSWIPHASEFDKRYTNDIGVAAGPGCYVVEYNATKSCFTHFCPTYQGTSGSPLFTRGSSGAWNMLAVHVGVAKPDDHAYDVCTADSNDFQNAAVAIDAKTMAKYMTQGK